MRLRFRVSLATLLAWNAPVAFSAVSDTEYNAVIERARAGDTARPLEQLKHWVAENPEQPRYLYDYVTLLGWASRSADALYYWPQLDRPETPDYVLLNLGRAARSDRRLATARKIYGRLLHRSPRNPEAIAGLALTAADDGQADAALDHIRQYLESERKPYGKALVPLLLARGDIEQRRGSLVDAAATYEEILAITPTDREALRARVFVAARLGAPGLAADDASSTPELFREAELRALRHDAIAREIRWGEARLLSDFSTERYAGIDRALAETDRIDSANRGPGSPDSVLEQRISFNRMLALRDRLRMRDVIELYEELHKRGVTLPAYALAAAADAFLHEHRPERARDLYLQALAMTSTEPGAPNREWAIGLIYAYIGCEQFTEARRLVDSLVAKEPPYVNQGTKPVQLDNLPYVELRHVQALERLYADQLRESQRLFEKYLAYAPYNTAARTSYGTLLSARERPRAAQERFRGVLVDDPNKLDARVGYAETQLALHDYRDAEAGIAALNAYEPASQAVQRAQRAETLYRRPQLIMESNAGGGDRTDANSVTGSRDYLADSRLYSSPLAYNWRVYAHDYYSEGRFGGQAAVRHLSGIGGEYRAPGWQTTTELTHEVVGTGRTGVSASVLREPSDDWQLRAALATDSTAVPLKARLYSIDGRDYQLGATRIVNEARRWDAGLTYVDFSDGNRRLEWSADWFERWVSGPVYKLDMTLGVSRSSNTLAGAPYFNPRSDVATDLSLVSDWLTWRRETRCFRQRLLITAGGYYQERFGTRPSFSVGYEHEWNADDAFVVRYGIARTQHSYDGVAERFDSFHLNLSWSL